jgi:hypothetical protein
MRAATRWFAIAVLACGCGDDGDQRADAAIDAMRRLAITVDGPASIQPTTRSIKVTITASGFTTMETFPIAGLPATVDVAQPVALSAWAVELDGFNTSGGLVGHAETSLPSGTAETMMTLTPI